MRRSADAAHMGQSLAERFRFSDHADVRGFRDGPLLAGWGTMSGDYARLRLFHESPRCARASAKKRKQDRNGLRC